MNDSRVLLRISYFHDSASLHRSCISESFARTTRILYACTRAPVVAEEEYPRGTHVLCSALLTRRGQRECDLHKDCSSTRWPMNSKAEHNLVFMVVKRQKFPTPHRVVDLLSLPRFASRRVFSEVLKLGPVRCHRTTTREISCTTHRTASDSA
jgi:hypothetical protein